MVIMVVMLMIAKLRTRGKEKRKRNNKMWASPTSSHGRITHMQGSMHISVAILVPIALSGLTLAPPCTPCNPIYAVSEHEYTEHEREYTVNEREYTVNEREHAVNERAYTVNEREYTVNEWNIP